MIGCELRDQFKNANTRRIENKRSTNESPFFEWLFNYKIIFFCHKGFTYFKAWNITRFLFYLRVLDRGIIDIANFNLYYSTGIWYFNPKHYLVRFIELVNGGNLRFVLIFQMKLINSVINFIQIIEFVAWNTL